MGTSEVDKCYICDLIGDYEGFQDIKNQFGAQHDCWNRNKCDICDKKYDSREELQNHKNRAHPDLTGIKSKVDNYSKDQTEINIQQINLKDGSNSELIQESSQDKVNILKTRIKRELSNTEKLQPIRINNGSKWKCPCCAQIRNNSGNMNIHIRTHTGEKPYQCSYCSAVFPRKTSLNIHIRTHTGEKPYQCSYCSAAFSQKTSLTSHIRTHTGEKPYQCSNCSAAFSQKTSLTNHIRTHTGEKPYACSKCSSAFGCKQPLDIHMRIHTGEKPFKCSKCSLAFSHRTSLTYHIKTHKCEKP